MISMAQKIYTWCKQLWPAMAYKGVIRNSFLENNAEQDTFVPVVSLERKKVDGKIVSVWNPHKNLRKIMLHPEVKDRPVIIVSETGKGRSVLLRFFLKYMETQDDSWSLYMEPLERDQQYGGLNEKMFISSKPRIRTSKNGEKVAELVIKTESALHTSTTQKDCIDMLCLNNSISSVQVHNVLQKDLKEDFDQLSQSCRYGIFIAEKSGHNIARQHRLIVLVHPKDGNYAKNGHMVGYERSSENGNNQKVKTRDINSYYANISEFVLRNPRSAVAGSSLKKVPKGGTDMDEFFTKKIFEDDLVPRQLDGQVPTGKEMLKFIQDWIFQAGDSDVNMDWIFQAGDSDVNMVWISPASDTDAEMENNERIESIKRNVGISPFPSKDPREFNYSCPKQILTMKVKKRHSEADESETNEDEEDLTGEQSDETKTSIVEEDSTSSGNNTLTSQPDPRHQRIFPNAHFENIKIDELKTIGELSENTLMSKLDPLHQNIFPKADFEKKSIGILSQQENTLTSKLDPLHQNIFPKADFEKKSIGDLSQQFGKQRMEQLTKPQLSIKFPTETDGAKSNKT
uniref:Atlastin-2-like isoform X2 n=1 Tax=Crassostrea virginica TaxID=6565 RepID=A0A8B8EWC2_CRAVI|nr:atlastin-2-like isoform X2 [Crassostrea virginica]